MQSKVLSWSLWKGIWKDKGNIMSHWRRKGIRIQLKPMEFGYAWTAFMVVSHTVLWSVIHRFLVADILYITIFLCVIIHTCTHTNTHREVTRVWQINFNHISRLNVWIIAIRRANTLIPSASFSWLLSVNLPLEG